jgi:hypothetical protein
MDVIPTMSGSTAGTLRRQTTVRRTIRRATIHRATIRRQTTVPGIPPPPLCVQRIDGRVVVARVHMRRRVVGVIRITRVIPRRFRLIRDTIRRVTIVRRTILRQTTQVQTHQVRTTPQRTILRRTILRRTTVQRTILRATPRQRRFTALGVGKLFRVRERI